jgi:hypothetical protein
MCLPSNYDHSPAAVTAVLAVVAESPAIFPSERLAELLEHTLYHVHVFLLTLQVTEMFEQLSTMVVDSTQASVGDLANKQQQVSRARVSCSCCVPWQPNVGSTGSVRQHQKSICKLVQPATTASTALNTNGHAHS